MIKSILDKFKNGFGLLQKKGDKNMAGRSGKTIINININTDEQDIFDVLGRGVVGVNRTVPVIDRKIEVRLDKGLEFTGPEGQEGVSVKVGPGLDVNSYSQVYVKTGEGLAIDSEGKVCVTAKASDLIGEGLKIDEFGKVTIDTGEGLEIQGGQLKSTKQSLGDGLAYDNQGRLIVDNSTPGSSDSFTAISDTKLSFNQGVLTLTKVVTTYNVSRSKVGNVLSITPVSNRLENEHVNLGGGGYGLGFHTVPDRDDETTPSFYRS